MKNPFHYCNKCNKYIEDLNELEEQELKENGAFVCSDCINEEMTAEEIINATELSKEDKAEIDLNKIARRGKI